MESFEVRNVSKNKKPTLSTEALTLLMTRKRQEPNSVQIFKENSDSPDAQPSPSPPGSSEPQLPGVPFPPPLPSTDHQLPSAEVPFPPPPPSAETHLGSAEVPLPPPPALLPPLPQAEPHFTIPPPSYVPESYSNYVARQAAVPHSSPSPLSSFSSSPLLYHSQSLLSLLYLP
eukprot:TRINITY_DN9228_c0_g1_i1.p1 TRINITY_DN9228_c0_g1~~TRINITY_DN9228_c0_g1_i1.p1  ORF type:complete len:173 (-),score=38.76 TRINITY_DN9228_c0_g1_i1:70-588(-)